MTQATQPAPSTPAPETREETARRLARVPRDPRRVHLIAVCGTGMGSLAGLLVEAGHRVQGSDENVYPPMSTMLRSRGITILEGYRAANLEPRPDLVVVGNIAGAANPEARAIIDLGIEHLSMPQALAVCSPEA